MNFNYLAIPQCDAANLAIALAGGPDCVSAVGPVPGNYATYSRPALDTNTAFGEDVSRGYRPDRGVRIGRFRHHSEGADPDRRHAPLPLRRVRAGFGVLQRDLRLNVPNGACIAAGHCGFGINFNKTEDGIKSRGNLTWHINQDILAYYTLSQGFRPGGFNRTSSQNLIRRWRVRRRTRVCRPAWSS